MQVEQLEVMSLDRETATEKWKECLQAEKTSSEAHIRDLKKAYYELSKGHKILDFFETVKKLPLNKDGDPSVAIAPANRKTCLFHKDRNGAGSYGVRNGRGWKARNHWEVILPGHTFPDWPTQGSESWNIIRNNIETSVPIVPAQYLPKTSLGNRFILWEVDKWVLAAPKDPLLLRRITANLFAIEAKWNLSRLERAIIRGRL